MIDGMPRPRPPHLHHERTRHKTLVWYVRIGKGPRIRIKEAYGTPEFEEAYQAALRGEKVVKRGHKAGSLGWLIARYKDSSDWAALSVATRRQRENILRKVIAAEGAEPFTHVTKKAITAARDRRRNQPAAARHFLDTMRGMFEWAVGADMAASNPVAGVKPPKKSTDGHHTWTDEECAKYEARWPAGTRQRLALDLLLYTGLRRGDVVRLGRQHIRDGVATIKTEKTGQEVTIPILPPLADSIAKSPTGDLAFVCGERGEPLTKESFGNYFRKWCKDAGVPGRAHGLRKAGATRAANNGATVHQLEALFGWRGGGMAALYTRKADRARLGKEAGQKLMPNAYSRTDEEGAGCEAKKEAKSNG